MTAVSRSALIELANMRRSSGGTCPFCRGMMHPWLRVEDGGLPVSVDHIIPRAWSGDDAPENLRLMCRACNSMRGSVGHCVGALACVLAVATPKMANRTWAQWRSKHMTPNWSEVIRRTTPKKKMPTAAPAAEKMAEPFIPPDPSIFRPTSPFDTYGGKEAKKLTARLIKISGIIAMRSGVKSI